MNAEHFQRVKALFDSLVDLTEAQRSELTERLHGVGDATRRRVHDLLRADLEIGERTARPAVRRSLGDAGSTVDAQGWLGRRIGAYLIDSELGRGGMGSVFL